MAIRLIAFIGVIWLLPVSGFSESSPASFSLDVPPGQWKTIRLQNLPKDLVVGIAVTSNGMVSVGFLSPSDHSRFPRLNSPLFWGQTESKLGFSVVIPQQSDYYFVVDNRSGTASRHVTFSTQAKVTEAAAQALFNERVRKVELQLKALEEKLNQTFMFDPVLIQVKRCQSPLSFERGEKLTLCLQYAQQLMRAFQDTTQASDALVYSLFQEMARAFDSQWNLGSADFSIDLDELTTVLMLTFRLDASVRAYSQTIINQPGLSASLVETFKDPLHPLTTERAERVLAWATNPHLLRSWQSHLVPHMQTRVLHQLKAHPQPWSDLHIIEEELAARDRALPHEPPIREQKDKIKA
jgi:hypothetical protein